MNIDESELALREQASKLRLLDESSERQFLSMGEELLGLRRAVRWLSFACISSVIVSICAGSASIYYATQPKVASAAVKPDGQEADALEKWKKHRAEETDKYLQAIIESVRAAHAEKDRKHGDDKDVEITHLRPRGDSGN